MRRRPSVGLAIAVILGTWLGLTLSPDWRLPLSLAVASWVAAFLLRDHPGAGAASLRRFPPGSAAAALLACAACAACAMAAATGVPLRAIENGNVGGRIVVRGVVADDPEYRSLSSGRRGSWRFLLRVRGLADPSGAWRRAAGDVWVSVYGGSDALAPAYGEMWKIVGRPAGVRPGTYGHGDRREGSFRVLADARDCRYMSSGHGSWFHSLCYESRRECARILTIGVADLRNGSALPRSLLLGYRDQITSEMQALFTNTGTLHVVAISGTHVVLFGGILLIGLRWMRVAAPRWVLVMGPALAAYAIGTGGRASAARACLMAVVFFAAPMLGRRPDTLSALAWSALLILAWDPLQLIDTGFVLSFVVVLGLVVFYGPLERPLRRLWRPDPLRAAAEPRWLRLWHAVVKEAVSLVLVSLIAWVFSTPLTAYMFGRFTPVTLVANLVVVPLAFLSVTAGCLSLLTGMLSPWMAGIFNHANYALSEGMLASMRWMVRLPGGSAVTASPPLWAVWTWFAALGMLALVLYACKGDARDSVELEGPAEGYE